MMSSLQDHTVEDDWTLIESNDTVGTGGSGDSRDTSQRNRVDDLEEGDEAAYCEV